MSEPLEQIAHRMRTDWNARALEDAKHYVYTRDPNSDELDFDASGRANYAQLIRPYLPVLLRGAHPRNARALEIGCGLGRVTRCFAENFGEVHGIDVAPEMVAQAQARLAGYTNVTLHTGSGFDLQPLPDSYFDLVFSYIVFQHIPSAEVIRNYIREAARVLKPLGAFKFQLNGDQSDAYRGQQRDTWLGESFSRKEVKEMLDEAGLTLAEVEDPGTQYFVVTAFKGPAPDRSSYFLPGQPDDGGWRPVAPNSTMRLHSPGASKLYAAMYFWPADPHQEHQVTMSVNGASLGSRTAQGPGDHCLEWTLPKNETSSAQGASMPPGSEQAPLCAIQTFEFEVTMDIEPACDREHWPALRIVGLTS